MVKKFKRLFIFCILLLVNVNIFSLTVPQLQGPVNDLAGIISYEKKVEIEDFLFNIEKKADLQIVVLTIKSLENEILENYSLRVAETWRLGSKERDSGVLLLIAADDRKMRIETGYGIEDKLTDAHAGRIIRNVIAPEFKTGDYGNGILSGVKSIAGYALKDENLISESEKSENCIEGYVDFLLPFFIIILWFIFFRGIPCFFWIPYRLMTGQGFSGSELAKNLFSKDSVFKLPSSSGRGGGRGYSGGGGRFGGGGASGGW